MSANWRDTYRPARFVKIDARISFLILPTMLYFRWYTVVPTLLAAVILYWLEKRLNMDVPSALRAIRSYIAGPYRIARPGWKALKFVDFERRW